MKTLILALSILSAPAFAAESTKLLEVSRHSGFVPQDYAVSSKCSVGSEHTLLQHTFGKKGRAPETSYEATQYTRDLPDADAVTAAIKQAARAKLLDEQGPVDGPTDTYIGILEGRVVDQHVKLLGKSTSGHDFRNQGKQVPALVEFADLNCPWAKLGE